ncbi:hypothetical protein JDV09_03720 [Mycobacterium sp. Y57]|uniref:hypothetical protein n=1 Tax=Mycolicibacterium xanthum TaxID=2796469 RepID=UPI001C85301F|nr:hypothetical protein [Mycolicibacterium xanthum]MBX7431222.1 hypothetical protein [Mycolicibacterium xanthum]
MSSLLVALIPGMLMLVTFGLDRVEASLDRDTISAAEVAEFLQQATVRDIDTLAGVGTDTMPAGAAELTGDNPRPDLPTRGYIHHRPKTEFQQTRHADRV